MRKIFKVPGTWNSSKTQNDENILSPWMEKLFQVSGTWNSSKTQNDEHILSPWMEKLFYVPGTWKFFWVSEWEKCAKSQVTLHSELQDSTEYNKEKVYNVQSSVQWMYSVQLYKQTQEPSVSVASQAAQQYLVWYCQWWSGGVMRRSQVPLERLSRGLVGPKGPKAWTA